jgi:AcrR family transcriptional regulator
MGRPSKTDDPRRSILEAARAEVLESGHRKLSLRAVAARAGFSPASLYEYFDGKDELIAALAGEAAGRMGASLRAAAAKARAPGAALVEVGLGYIAFARANREDFLLLSNLESTRQSLTEPISAASPYRVVYEGVRKALEAGGRRASPRAVDLRAYVLWAAAHGMAMLQATHLAGFATDFPAADREGLEALVRGLDLDP